MASTEQRLERLKRIPTSRVTALTTHTEKTSGFPNPKPETVVVAVLENGRVFASPDGAAWDEAPPVPGTQAASIFYRHDPEEVAPKPEEAPLKGEREILVPLKCQCGNKDDQTIIAPICSAECGHVMALDVIPPDRSAEAVRKVRWATAKAHLDETIVAYKRIGPPGQLGLTLSLSPLFERYVDGERSDDLLEKMEGVK